MVHGFHVTRASQLRAGAPGVASTSRVDAVCPAQSHEVEDNTYCVTTWPDVADLPEYAENTGPWLSLGARRETCQLPAARVRAGFGAVA